jgi:outer membrane murein-binding lipoprotein Lpp
MCAIPPLLLIALFLAILLAPELIIISAVIFGLVFLSGNINEERLHQLDTMISSCKYKGGVEDANKTEKTRTK